MPLTPLSNDSKDIQDFDDDVRLIIRAMDSSVSYTQDGRSLVCL